MSLLLPLKFHGLIKYVDFYHFISIRTKCILCMLICRPFGQCYELLTMPTIQKYFIPIIVSRTVCVI